MRKRRKLFVKFDGGSGGGNINYNSQLVSNNLQTIGFSSFSSPVAPSNPFISTWRTTSASETITLPYEVAGTYSGTIDWGDGGATSINDYSNITHTYAVSGDYVVTITGVTTGFRFNNSGDRTKIRSIQNWGTLKLGNNGSYFYGCTNLTLTSVMGTLDLTATTILGNCFRSCSSLTTINNINSWTMTNITSMTNMFLLCTNFNQALNFDTQNVLSMGGMFQSCTNFNSTLTFTSTANVSNMGQMFNVSSNFNQPLNFNTIKVTNMGQMFAGALKFNQPLTFDTGAVTSMQSMFFACYDFNSALTFTNTSLVENMSSMFNNCIKFNQPLNFDTIGVLYMSSMFYNCTIFNQPLNFNTGLVQNMSDMFTGATAFQQNIGSWNVANVTNFLNFMSTKTPATFSTANLDAIYNGWIVSGVKPNINISFGGLITGAKYSASGVLGRAVLTSAPNNWIILDGGL